MQGSGIHEVSGEDSYGVYFDVPMEFCSSYVYMRIRSDKVYRIFPYVGINEVWISSENTLVSVSAYGTPYEGLTEARLVAPDKMVVGFTDGYVFDMDMLSLEEASITEWQALDKNHVELLFNGADIPRLYRVHYDDQSMISEIDSRLMDEWYAVDGVLGQANARAILYSALDDSTVSEPFTFSLWAPLADEVRTVFYNDDYQLVDDRVMKKDAKGLWSVVVNRDKFSDDSDYYYHYIVTNPYCSPQFVRDPYARSGIPQIGAATDVSTLAQVITTPLSSYSPVQQKKEIRSVSSMSISDAIMSQYLVQGSPSDVYMNVSELQELGVNTLVLQGLQVHDKKRGGVKHLFLPAKVLSNKEESDIEYLTVNSIQNSKENPREKQEEVYRENQKPSKKNDIKIMRDLLKILNDQKGMRTLIDMTNLYMSRRISLDSIVPGYYLTKKTADNYACFNRLDLQARMSARLLVDSIIHWFEVYRIEGVKYDSIGELDSRAMDALLTDIASFTETPLLIARHYDTTCPSHHVVRSFFGASSDGASSTNTNSQESDVIDLNKEPRVVYWLNRNFAQQSVGIFDQEGTRFTKGILTSKVLVRDFAESIVGRGSELDNPYAKGVVQYLVSDGDLSLSEQIQTQMQTTVDDATVIRLYKNALAMIMTSQGPVMVPQDIQNWSTQFSTEEVRELRAYLRALSRIRQETDAFSLGDPILIFDSVKFFSDSEKTDRAYGLRSKDSASGTVYYVFVNGDTKPRSFIVPQSLRKAAVLVDATQYDIGGFSQSVSVGMTLDNTIVRIDPRTVVILRD